MLAAEQSDYLPNIVKSFSTLQKYTTHIKATKVMTFSDPIPECEIIPQQIPCIIEEIPGNSTEHKILLPSSSVQLFFEEKRSIIISLLVHYKITQNANKANSIFHKYVDSNKLNTPDQIDEFKQYFPSFKSTIMGILNRISNYLMMLTPLIYYGYKRNQSQNFFNEQCSIVVNYIAPALILAKKIKEYKIGNDPCSFQILKEKPTDIYNVERLSPQGSLNLICSYVKSIIDSVSNKYNNSLSIHDTVLDKFRLINAEIKKRKILKKHEEIMNSVMFNQSSLSNLPALLKEQKIIEGDEESKVKLAYIIATAGLNLALFGVGQNSHSKFNFNGVNIYPNCSNVGNTIFAITLDSLSTISLSFCREIQNVINEPFLFKEFENLKENENENVKDYILKLIPYYKTLSKKYKQFTDSSIAKYETEKKEFENLIVSLADQLKIDNTKVKNSDFFKKYKSFFNKSLPKAVQTTIKSHKLIEKFQKLEKMFDSIEDLNNKKCFVTWIEQIPMIIIEKDILGIRGEINGNDIHLSAIHAYIESNV